MTFIGSHILSLTVFLPLIGMFLVLCLPSHWKKEIRLASLFISLGALLLATLCFLRIKGTGEFEIMELAEWIPALSVTYHLGMDGTSAALLLMTAILVPISILASWHEIDKSVKMFHALILLLETGMLGVFLALDVFLFYIFWELVLIPMYFIIGIWGSGDRVRVAIKFVLFTMVGSVLMLVAILYAAKVTGTFNILAWYAHNFAAKEQLWLFGAFALAFAIKVPLIGFHTWLPDAHTEAPTAGSILLAGVLLKMGSYGFFRFAMPLFPAAVAHFAPAILTFAVAGIILGALLAMVQPDIKRLVAYSSVSHMGFVILGLAALEKQAVAGAVLQMVNHGITTGALFLMIGMLYGRKHTRLIADWGGTARSLPILSIFFIFMVLSSMGLPGLNNFAGEFLILIGSFQTQTIYSAIAIIGVILAAAYLLWAVLPIFFGPLQHEEEKQLLDMRPREYLELIPVVIIIVIIGVWPQGVLSKIWNSADAFIKLSKRVEHTVILSGAKNPVKTGDPSPSAQGD